MLTSTKADDVLTNKRAADELPKNSKKNKRISNCGGETTESSITGLLTLPLLFTCFLQLNLGHSSLNR
jgi:hypothetical protein